MNDSRSLVGGYRRFGYGQSLATFFTDEADRVVGELARHSAFDVDQSQVAAWLGSIDALRQALAPWREEGHVFLEFDVPRLGRRIDAVLVLRQAVFVIEFKVGAKAFLAQDVDQVVDYALDLKHFHETSHEIPLVPVLVATQAQAATIEVAIDGAVRNMFTPILCNAGSLARGIACALELADGATLDPMQWVRGRYKPTPTIVEAAMALYARHKVSDISRSDAANLGQTSALLQRVIAQAREQQRKALCFVTGVPGAGKTLVGLDVATQSTNAEAELHAVYLSGNGPLVRVLQEALARDRVRREAEQGRKLGIGDARRQVRSFIQSIHHFRDEGLTDTGAPHDHVAIFDEAQRAWNRAQTAAFMQKKRGLTNFQFSEPEFLISCLDRHPSWAVVVCLVGNGQEINTGEAGIAEWLESAERSFPDWDVHVSPELGNQDDRVRELIHAVEDRGKLHQAPALHLATSVRSFRSERYSEFVNRLLDLDVGSARSLLPEVLERFPLCVTRDLPAAKRWLRARARGTERYGIVVSSEAQRLRPHAIDVRVNVDPVHWFLAGKEDTRSSYYLEDVATEFQVQGLELDWTCMVWDGDLRHAGAAWSHHSFVGDRWHRILKEDRRAYLVNAYRVLLTRARQGTVIVVPPGDAADPTRAADIYDPVYDYLRRVGVPEMAVEALG
jgi:broad-specificity NMP kinase